MGGSPSKRIEEKLSTSTSFQDAVQASFEEGMVLAQHAFPGLQAYQLLDASVRIYDKILVDEDDVVSRYKQRWLPHPPTQADIHIAVKKEGIFEGGGLQVVGLEDFRSFAVTLFRDMGLATACHRLALYVPVGSVGVLCAHLTANRLPLIGPLYRAAGPLMPGLLLGSVIGVVISVQLNLR